VQGIYAVLILRFDREICSELQEIVEGLGRRVEMVEYDPDPDQFLRNIFKPADVISLRNIFKPADVIRLDESGDGVITAYLGRKSDLGIAIGKGGCKQEACLFFAILFYSNIGTLPGMLLYFIQ